MFATLAGQPDAIQRRFAKHLYLMSDEPATLSVTEAARRLSVTGQTVRNWIRSGELDGRKQGSKWVVAAKSVDAAASALAVAPVVPAAPAGVEERLDRLTAAVERLAQRETASSKLMAALQRERDRFRAEAAASKEAALRVNLVARETDQAVRRLLDVLALQADTLAQLLAPSSPEDLLRELD
jgi:excisionase family DNA binding protein